ncbi:uncharacterized protein [Primulina huaijiensis]|uniref:uncharacterized protein n=1 Tax=Primulina huaijiensis TaxID=1492673 RepID=UPI003CC73103
MNFFKYVLSDDPVSLKPDQDNPNPNPATDDTSGGWSFGGLIKNFAARSESLLESYRRDLKEFGSGLRNETDNLREIASRAVKELPASLEAGASAAHGSLESVSHALDEVIKSTGEIVPKESMDFASDGESEALDTKHSLDSGGRYNWFESQLSLIQNDSNTFCQVPDDVDEYNEWKLRFDLGNKKG